MGMMFESSSPLKAVFFSALCVFLKKHEHLAISPILRQFFVRRKALMCLIPIEANPYIDF